MLLAGILLPATAVERTIAVEKEDEAVAREQPKVDIGFASESKLKTEPSGKAFFFLSNESPWPEKEALPPLPKPVLTVKKPERKPAPPAGIGGPQPEADPEAESPETTAVKAGVKKGDEGRKTAPAAKVIDKTKVKPVKKPGRPLPDIDKLLAEVRQSAKPKWSDAPTPRPAASGGPARIEPTAGPVEPAIQVAEVEGAVDMDALARDLENFQKSPAVKPAAVAPASETGTPWWWLAASLTVLAAGGSVLYWIKHRRPHIRSQSAIDSETRAYFKKLYAEQQKRAARRPVPVAAAPATADEPYYAPAAEAAPEPEDIEIPPPDTAEEPNIFLLPPELAEGVYREVVMLAGAGETAETIAGKLSLGEGEVRLVLDIARLSRYQTAGGRAA